MVVAGCASRQEVAISSPDDYLAALAKLELNPDKYDREKYYQIVIDKMDSWLKPIRQPKDLKELFYQCHAQWRSQLQPPQDRLTWIDPYFETLALIMYRLSDLRTDEAARTMVDLYCDKTIGWDAHFSEMGADAMARCSELTLPVLKERQKSGADVAWLIRLLESGTKRIL